MSYIFMLLTFAVSMYAMPNFSEGLMTDFANWLGGYLSSTLQAVIDAIRKLVFDLFTAITDFCKAVVLTIYDMTKDFLCFCFDSILKLLVTILDGLGSLFNAMDFTNTVDSLPSDLLNVMGLLGLGHCMSLIISALIIRLTLQLIPFTRLGS